MKKVIKNLLLALGIGLAVAALVARWPEVQPRLGGANWILLGLAAAGLLLYQLLNAGVWSRVLGALGHSVPFGQAARVWLQSEALRWLPGGIWGYGSRVVNARELGVDKGRASASLMLELALTNVAWMVMGGLLLLTPLAGMAVEAVEARMPQEFPWLLVGAGGLGVLGAVLLMLWKCGSVRRLILKVLGKLPWKETSPSQSLVALASYVVLCVFNGFLLWVVTRAVPGLNVNLLTAIGIGGGAWLVGFWAIGVPGGIGVREAALAGMLAFFGDLDAGIAVAVLWRAMQMAIELVSLVIVTLPFRIGTEGKEERECRRLKTLGM